MAELARSSSLVRPSGPIPEEATAVHGIGDAEVAVAPCFAQIAVELLCLLDGAVFVSHNAPFDLGMLQHAFERAGIDYQPAGVACTLDAFRLLDPLAPDHRLESVCRKRAIPLPHPHNAFSDARATVALLRLLLDRGLAPETIRLDHAAFMRLRSDGDTRPATAAQIRRVFALAYAAGLAHDRLIVLVARTTGMADVDGLTREQVQNVFDALDRRASGVGRESRMTCIYQVTP